MMTLAEVRRLHEHAERSGAHATDALAVRDAAIRELLAGNTRPAAIARELGLSRERIRQIAQSRKEQP